MRRFVSERKRSSETDLVIRIAQDIVLEQAQMRADKLGSAAGVYFSGLHQAADEGGLDGLATQLVYLSQRMIIRTPKERQARDAILAIGLGIQAALKA